MRRKILSLALAAIMVVMLIPAAAFAEIGKEESTRGYSISFVGDEFAVERPQVGDEFTWKIQFPLEETHMASAAILVDYDENYMTPVSASSYFDGSLMSNYSNADEQLGDEPVVMLSNNSNLAYCGGTGTTPYGESGNWYVIVLASAKGTFNGGIMMSGDLAAITFRWTNVPDHNEDIQMGVIIDELKYDAANGGGNLVDYAAQDVIRVDGVIHALVEDPCEVTYEGQEVILSSEPQVNNTFQWLFNVSRESRLFSGHWMINYDENYLTCTANNWKWNGGIWYDITNNNEYSSTPEITCRNVSTVQSAVTGLNGQTVNSGDVVTNFGLAISENLDYGGLLAGGDLVRLTYKWINIPDRSQLMHDDRGDYLPMPIVTLESEYYVNSASSNFHRTHDVINEVPGKIYFPEQMYTLTINYIYENGQTAATTYTAQYQPGASYSVQSPTISGYEPDIATVSGTINGDTTITVTYYEVESGHHIIVTDYTKGKATTSISADTLYSGDVTFTVACDLVCTVALMTGNDTYTVLKCTTSGNTHSYTVTVNDADVEIVVVVKGDANLDAKLSSVDATFIKQASIGNRTLGMVNFIAADFDKNNRISSLDALRCIQVVAGSNSYTW